MQDGAELRAATCVDVHGGAHDHARHRQATDEACEHVADALRHEFAVRRCLTLIGVDLLDGLQIQQRLQRRDECDSDSRFKDERIAEVLHRRELQEAEEGLHIRRHRHLHEVGRLHLPSVAHLPQDQIDRHTNEHHDECGGHGQFFECLHLVPHQQEDHRQYADERRTGQDVRKRCHQLGEGVFMVWLGKAHFALRIGIVAENVGDLLQDQNEADGCEEAFNDTHREERCDEAESKRAHQNLHRSRHDHRRQKGLKTAQHGDLRRHDGRESRRRSAHAFFRSAEDAHHDPTDDPGDQTGKQRRIRCQGNAKTQRQRHEKHGDACGDVLRQGDGERSLVVGHGFNRRLTLLHHALTIPLFQSVN